MNENINAIVKCIDTKDDLGFLTLNKLYKIISINFLDDKKRYNIICDIGIPTNFYSERFIMDNEAYCLNLGME